MKLLAREVEIVELICPVHHTVLNPLGPVQRDNVLMGEDGIEEVSVAVLVCPKCGGCVAVAFREKA